MKSAKYVLLVIGALGIAASVYGSIIDEEITNHIIGLVCGASLIYGYFELNKADK